MIFIQQLIDGLQGGAVYGLLGMAIVIVMKSTDVPNFAAAEVGLVGVYFCWFLMSAPGGPSFPAVASIIFALAFCALLNVFIQVTLVRPFTGLSPLPLAICVAIFCWVGCGLYMAGHKLVDLSQPTGWVLAISLSLAFAILGFLSIRFGIVKSLRIDHFALLLMTIGLVFVISAILHLIWGSETKSLAMPWTGKRMMIGNIPVSAAQMVTIVTGFIVAIAVGAFFKTPWGVRMRAIAEDGNTARLLGINSSRVSMLAWAIAGVISGITMILRTSQTVISTSAGEELILSGFIAAILGGFTSLGGAFIGGLIVGLSEALVGGLISTNLQPTIALLVVVVVLLISPNGLAAEKMRRQI